MYVFSLLILNMDQLGTYLYMNMISVHVSGRVGSD